MIYVSYYRLKNRLKPESFDQLLQSFPTFIQNKILKFRNWQDAERSLAGNLLLMMGLQTLGLATYSLNNLKYTEFQKPYLDDAVSFNVSHSGEYIICAISETNKVGVDVEGIKNLPIEDFTNLFADIEWNEVISSENKLYAFYTLWTKKEAFLKVIGCGLSQPLNEVVIENNRIFWKDNEWFLHEIKLDPQHISYLCCNAISPLIEIREVYF